MSPHHSDQMSLMSQVYRVALCFLSRTDGPTYIGSYRAVSDMVWTAKKRQTDKKDNKQIKRQKGQTEKQTNRQTDRQTS